MSQLQDLISKRILILDGAMGTALQTMSLTADDFGGEALLGCNEHLVLSKPEAIKAVHMSYLEAGADIVETNTFGGTDFVLGEYGLQDKVYEINYKAVQLARQACDHYSTPEKPRFVAGAMGPTTKSLSVTGGMTFDELANSFYGQAVPLIESGADYLLLETALDTLNIKAGYIGILKAFEKTGKQLPIAVSGTIETMGTMLAGQDVEALYTSIEHMSPLYIGLNCATGPEFMRDHIRSLAAISRYPISVVPNAGIPDEEGVYPEGPEALAATLSSFMKEGWVNIVGGCCGTTAGHIKALAENAPKYTPFSPLTQRASRVSGIETLIMVDEDRPYIIGERTNVIGSRIFKNLISEEKFDEASEVARKQVRAGAHIIDVCLSNPDRDEKADMELFLNKISRVIKAPIMVDSQVPEVVEAAFKLIQGKALLNSVNLEDGEKAFEELLPIVKKYGAAVVVGCIMGEMAVTAKDKLRVAEASHALLTEKYGIPEEDIIFDPLVFPCGTGDENYFGSGAETIEGVRLIKERFPRCKTTLGISNVSFGLPPAGREVLNSVYLYHCTKSGLDTAIVNSEKLVRYSTITEEEKKLCDDLLWYRTENGNDPVANFAAYFRDKKVETVVIDRSTLSIEKKLEINIVEGTKEYLIENLDEALEKWDPLGVINNPLMAGMAIVGRLFNNNELIVAEVLQSAEVMKAAVAYLETFMEQVETHTRGKMLLATVKGDVHDIGKNLVEIILSNNGYKVIDLGIKCPAEKLIEAYNEHKPDFIGLSGLLVKSAQQMVLTAQDLKEKGINIPILVGGAALSERFTNIKIAPEYDGPVVYCKDAMNGLAVANTLMNHQERDAFIENLKRTQSEASQLKEQQESAPKKEKPDKKVAFDFSNIQAKAPDFEPHIIEGDIQHIWDFINPQMLYGNHLGVKGKITTLLEKKDEKFMKLHDRVEEFKRQIIADRLLEAKGMFQFFKVKTEGDSLYILNKKEEIIETFMFPRQSEGSHLCLTDFCNPNGLDEVCAFVVTCGDGVGDLAKEFLNKGDYFNSHVLSAIALESAEGFAEYLHHKIRNWWGIGDPKDLSVEDMFKVKYTGIRVSFGYPACPRLEDQEKLWSILRPDKTIGVQLSEECMMSPEASVSALVFHHPQSRYFTIKEYDLAAFEKRIGG